MSEPRIAPAGAPVRLRVLNARVVGRRPHPHRRYCGRPSRWGNRFVIGRDGDRATVIALYAAELDRRIAAGDVTDDELVSLAPFDLVCHCAPAPCHLDVLVARVHDALARRAAA